jgi:Tat protein secretion system quality control protein TatD with DNase activity
MVHTAQKLAELRGELLEEVSRITTENFRRLLLKP